VIGQFAVRELGHAGSEVSRSGARHLHDDAAAPVNRFPRCFSVIKMVSRLRVLPSRAAARRDSMRLCEFCLHNGTADAGKSVLHSGKCPEVLAARALCRHRKAMQ
jgi:hypothetical protein